MRRRSERRRAAAAAAAAKVTAATAGAVPIAANRGGGALPVSAAAPSLADGAPSTSSSGAPPRGGARKPLAIHPAEQFKLHVHGHEFQNGEELVLNPDFFPQLKELHWDDYVVEVFHPRTMNPDGETMVREQTKEFGESVLSAARHHLLMEIPHTSNLPIRGKMQVSVLNDTAADFHLAAYKDVMVRFVAKAHVEVDFIEVSLKDQFMSRRDLWYLKKSIVGSAIYVGKNIRVHGARWQVMDIRAGGEKVSSGVISEKTKFAFRSRTSRVMWLVQLSPEMWDIANSGKLYMEIFLNVVENVLNKWMKHKVSHSLTIIFFARNYYPELEQEQELSTSGRKRCASSASNRTRLGTSSSSRKRGEDRDRTFPYERRDYFPIGVDENGRHYQDFYKVVAFDKVVMEVQPLLVKLKRELNEFPHACGWRTHASPYYTLDRTAPSTSFTGLNNESVPRQGDPSYARDGNLLEAINLVLNIFEKHHIDRHLARSGQSVVLMTAGNGIFSVNKRLAEITEQRMMDHGIGIDLISLATPPLHKCPLFLFRQSDLTDMKLPSRAGETNAVADACVCANQNNQNNQKAAAFQRRSRTSSNDGMFDSQSIADGGVASVRNNPLCKYCTQRLENRKNYVIPLWIPLCFVQEEMMVDHKCPLDEDIARSCPVCHPKVAKVKDFVPLPMCRMFKDDRSMHALYSLPKPLKKLLNRFQEPDSSGSDDDDENGISATMISGMSTYNDLMFAGFDSDLVRARSPSITSVDDMITYGGDMLPKVRSFSPADRNKALQEFEKYDEQVFGFSGNRGTVPSKSSDGDRLCLTPPLRPIQPPGSNSKKRAGTGSVMTFQSSSAGNNATTREDNAVSQWRQLERSSSPLPLDGSPSSDGKLVSDDELSVLDYNKPRNISGSLPSTYQLDSGPSYAPYTTSPMLRPTEVVSKDDLFSSQAFIFSSKLTSNQRRWSQIRPNEDAKYRLVQNMLKWKSLCFPALLPLTSDFFPTSKELQAHYTESFYSVTLPERDEQNGVTFRDYSEFVMEMVAQRFSQDFQLVEMGDAGEKSGTVFRLSMGHRVHEITFNEETQTIDVKRYLQKAKVRSDIDIMEYRYSLWSPVAHAFLSVSQEFRKYPRLEYSWNYLDQLICGYYDEMSEGTRYKRILYCIVPPRLEQSEQDKENLRDYTERCKKFLEYLRPKADTNTGFPNVRISTEWKESMATSGVDAFKRVAQENVKVPMTMSDAPTSQNWVITRIDTELLSTQCFHVEVQWLVCRSSLVDDFITGIVRRAKQLGLEFIQVPENGISSNLDMHPMICPIFLPVTKMIEKALIERFNFCCEALHPIPFTHLNHSEEYAILHQEPRIRNRRVISYYRQYVHRTLSCFVRMTQTGLVWISNRKLMSDEVQELFDGLRQLVDSVHIAHSAVADVVDRAFETRDAIAAAEKEDDSNGDIHAHSGSDEGDHTETNTTDEDNNERVSTSSNSSIVDEDKENANP
uniref:Uncharacterized protein n=1 Tax=Globisporangium ultimum (strain ATCC 200006 / CBS 805.95 / DAOM BR144) TaxID=431595 RepID=K3W9W3_GLOUD